MPATWAPHKVLVVTDPGVLEVGWAGEVLEGLEAEGLAYSVFSQVTSNPRADEVMAGVERYRDDGCDVIVAVGGGSPRDCAKGMGISGTNEQHVLEFEGVDEVAGHGPLDFRRCCAER